MDNTTLFSVQVKHLNIKSMYGRNNFQKQNKIVFLFLEYHERRSHCFEVSLLVATSLAFT